MREAFEEYIDQQIRSIPLDYLDLNAGEIHRAIGGYPGPNHRMPQCCEVMYSRMAGDDTVICSVPKGKGASLTIRYFKHNH